MNAQPEVSPAGQRLPPPPVPPVGLALADHYDRPLDDQLLHALLDVYFSSDLEAQST